MAHLGVVDEEELDVVCSERETVLNRRLVLKRRPDFDEMILPARKVARSGAEREQAVCFSLCLFDL